MRYTEKSRILSIDDVKEFFNFLIYDCNVMLHPDERFENYADLETEKQLFTPEQCAILDHLMDMCFDVCEMAGEDIYEICNKLTLPDIDMSFDDDLGDLGY